MGSALINQKCLAISCGVPPAVYLSELECGLNVKGVSCNYTCQKGYATSDPTSIHCKPGDTDWGSQAAPTCQGLKE